MSEESYLIGYISKKEIQWFQEMQSEARTRAIQITTFPMVKDDVCVKIILTDEPQIKIEDVEF